MSVARMVRAVLCLTVTPVNASVFSPWTLPAKDAWVSQEISIPTLSSPELFSSVNPCIPQERLVIFIQLPI